MQSKLILILFILHLQNILLGQNIKVLSSNANSAVIEFRPQSIDTITIKYENQFFIKVNIPGAYSDNRTEAGNPDIQRGSVNIGVPAEFGNTITVLSRHYKEYSGELIPVPQIKREKEDFTYEYVKGKNYNTPQNKELVSFGEFGYVRQLPVQSIEINPMEYYPSKKLIRVYDSIVFRVNFSKQVPTNTAEIKETEIKNSVLNFSVAKKWGKSKPQRMSKVSSSVLSSGTWYRFLAPEEGIYKIDRTMLGKLGIDAATVDPRTIKIYNNGGYELPTRLNETVPEDLVENAIYIVGETDGKFDSGDYILFYGRGNNFFEYNETSGEIERKKQKYSEKNYYWITSGGTTGKRMETKTSVVGTAEFNQTTTKAFAYRDNDLVNIMKSGTLYLGDEFTTSKLSNTYITPLTSRVSGSEIKYKFQFASNTYSALRMTVSENGNSIYSGVMKPAYSEYEIGNLTQFSAVYSGQTPEDRSVLKFTYDAQSVEDRGYFDYYELEYLRSLKVMDDQITVFSEDTSAVVKYTLTNFTNSDIYVFDVTNHSNVKRIDGASVSGGQISYQAMETKGNISKYAGCTSGKFKTVGEGTIEEAGNSDIRGITAGADLLIIGNKYFKEPIEKLINHKRTKNEPLSTELVYIDELFNEFSCGMLDPTAIRNMIKYAYENWENPPKMVLLFGDGEYDYLGREGTGKNFIPPYETSESLDDVYSYPYDEYYARVAGTDFKSDVGIGRINSSNLTEANNLVNKIIEYENDTERGIWKTVVTLIADDAYTSKDYEGSLHVGQSETLARSYIPDYLTKNKIYLSRYPTVQAALGRRKPAVNQAVIDAINNGTLMLNYIGHGNPQIWAHEVIFEKSTSIPLLNNQDYFFLTAATCDFGKWDSPEEQSATEEMMFLDKSGTIGAFTAARPVYSNQNARLNQDLYNSLVKVRDDDNLPVRFGIAFMNAKNSISYHEQNDEKFHLFGDPSVRINLPYLTADIDSVNGIDLSSSVQVKALSNTRIAGTVRDEQGNLNPINGEAILSVFDSEKKVFLQEMNYTMSEEGGIIFRGRVSIENGKFETSFIVPKDISYENRNGKIMSYIYNDDVDGVGYSSNIIVGGTDSSAVNDGTGPEVSIYYDDFTFNNAYVVNTDFTLLVKVDDQSGLNTTGTGVGHRLEAVLNGDEENPIDLTSYFIGDVDAGGKSGVVKYKFTNLEPGNYTIKVNAWDVFNNNTSQYSTFEVVSDDGVVMQDVVNYPNPFSNKTTFTFQRNSGEPIKVKIKIYTIAGRMINELESYTSEKFVKIDWDGRDRDGSPAGNGTYFYKLIVEAADGSYTRNTLGKLAIIR